VSDINTAMVDSLKVLDPKRPIREVDIQSPLALWFNSALRYATITDQPRADNASVNQPLNSLS